MSRGDSALDAATSVLLSRGVMALGAGPQRGYAARGTVVVATDRGKVAAEVAIEVWGGGHCKIAATPAGPTGGGGWTATLDGSRSEARGPREITAVVAAPARDHGCALLPQGTLLADLGVSARAAAAPGGVALSRPGAAGAAAFTLDAATGLPASVSFRARGREVRVEYRDYQAADGVAYPGEVIESADGAVCLDLHITAFEARAGLGEGDFALPPPRFAPPPTHGYPGAGATGGGR